jgi:hypothetical protein
MLSSAPPLSRYPRLDTNLATPIPYLTSWPVENPSISFVKCHYVRLATKSHQTGPFGGQSMFQGDFLFKRMLTASSSQLCRSFRQSFRKRAQTLFRLAPEGPLALLVRRLLPPHPATESRLIHRAAIPATFADGSTSNLTIAGVGAGRAVINAAGHNSQGKAIWVISGNNTMVEDIEFAGATVPDMNGAGIRAEGNNLTIRNCYFHDNQDGILTDGGNSTDHHRIQRVLR